MRGASAAQQVTTELWVVGMARERIAASVTARHGALKRSKSLANFGKVLLTGLVAFAISGIAVGAYAAADLVNDMDTIDLNPDDEVVEVGAGAEQLDGALTILLVGSDSREGSSLQDGVEGELNDVNLLLHIPADHQSATIMSFPRDTMVPIPECTDADGVTTPAMSESQLNNAMFYGGLPCVADTIEQLTGIEVPNAAVVTFDGVIALSHAIGGVTVCLAEPIYDEKTDLDLPAGNVSLEGREALQFLRTRYGVGDGSDKSRISNQQVFMAAMLRQMTSAQTLTNPIKVYSLAKAGMNNMTMSTSMKSIGFMQALASTVVDIPLDRINFVQYPTVQHPYDINRLTPDYALAEQLIQFVLSGEQFEAGEHGEAVAPTPTEEPPAEPQIDPETGEVIEPETPDPNAEEEARRKLEGLLGQRADEETCSAGRTQW